MRYGPIAGNGSFRRRRRERARAPGHREEIASCPAVDGLVEFIRSPERGVIK